ncbi:MAG: regulatory iron-sulfur-containing complex subunit RicT [Clostridia bacterium]
MDKIIGVRFRKTGKLYYFDPMHFGFRVGDSIIADTERGEELGRVVKIIDEKDCPKNIEIQKIIKPATKKDIDIFKENELRAKEALEFCKDEAKKLNLSMKLLLAEYTFDTSKLIFYFVSEERVDFRELVRNLAQKYKARIELRQIGPRDEVKSHPNLGMCGKEVCCRTYLQDFEPVTIKMAKEQGLQINMAKLSGACGKLMCCLKYEEEAYKENLEKLPKVGEYVKVGSDGIEGKVSAIDILKLKVKVRFGSSREDEKFETYSVEELTWKKKEEKK